MYRIPLHVAYESFYLELFHILSIIILVAINYTIYLKAKKTVLLYQYLALVAALLLWLVAKIFKTGSPDEVIRWYFIVAQYLGVSFLGSLFVMFAHTYATGRSMKPKYALLLNIPPVCCFLAAATNPYHMFFYSYYDYYRDSFGPIFYICAGISAIYMIIGILLCAQNFRCQFKEKRIQSRLFAIAIFIPLIANIFYDLKLYQRFFNYAPLFDPTPVTCNISLFIFALATFKYRFLDVLPIARRKALEQIAEGILLYDARGRIIHANRTFNEMLPKDSRVKQGQSVESLADILKSLGHDPTKQDFLIRWAGKRGQGYRETFQTRDGRYLKLEILPLQHRRHTIGAALRLIDATFQSQTMAALTEKNEALNAANQKLAERARLIRDLTITRIRSFAAREIHDILGHSMVLVISLLEVGMIALPDGAADAQMKVDQAIRIVKDSLRELEDALNAQSPGDASHHGWLKSLALMIAEAGKTGRKTDLLLQGRVGELPALHAEHIFRVCQEGITNAIRHGKASRINVILRFSSGGYEIYILDNGVGCEKIIKGYGISGMEERVGQLNGHIKYGSNENAGFTIHIAIPLAVEKSTAKSRQQRP